MQPNVPPADDNTDAYLSALEVYEARLSEQGEDHISEVRQELLLEYPAVAKQLDEYFTEVDNNDRFGRELLAKSYLEPGQFIRKYRLIHKLGEGGMGEVWKALDTALHRHVAMKFIKHPRDEKLKLRFTAEQHILATLNHPSIATLYEVGTAADGRSFVAMELVKGVPITTYVNSKEIPLKRRLELMLQVCSAVQYAHNNQIIHRDLKPSNILVMERDGQAVVKVIDFGLAKASSFSLFQASAETQFGAFIGTPEYMPPEQAELSPLGVDSRADVYSLGAVLYELLTGTPPFTREHLEQLGQAAIIELIKETDPPRPSLRLSSQQGHLTLAAQKHRIEPADLLSALTSELDWITLKAIEKDRDRRYATVDALQSDIKHVLADEPSDARPPSEWYRLRKLVKRHRRLALTTISIATVIGLATVATLIYLDWARRDAENAWQSQAEQHAIALAETKRANLATSQAERERVLAIQTMTRERLQLAHNMGLQGQPLDELFWYSRAFLDGPPNHPSTIAASNLLADRSQRINHTLLHAGAVCAAAFISDNTRVVTICAERPLRSAPARFYPGTLTATVWDVLTGRPLTKGITCKTSEITLVKAISEDGHFALVSGAGNPGWQLWDLATGDTKKLQAVSALLEPAEFCSNSTLFLTVTDGPTLLWDTSTAKVLRSLGSGERFENAVFSRNGDRIITATESGTIQLFETSSGEPTCEPFLPEFENDGMERGQVAVNGSFIISKVATTLHLWDAEDRSLIGILQKRGSACESAANEKLVMLTHEGFTCWSAITGQQLPVFPSEAELTSVSIASNGRTCLLGGVDGTAVLCNIDTMIPSTKAISTSMFADPVVSPNGCMLATIDEEHSGVQRWNLDGMTPLGDPLTIQQRETQPGISISDPKSYPIEVERAAFSGDGKWILAVGDGTAQVWDAKTGVTAVSRKQAGEEHFGFAKTQTLRLFKESDATMQCYDLVTDSAYGKALPFVDDTYYYCLLRPDGQTALIRDRQATQLWDIQQGERLGSPMAHLFGSTGPTYFRSGTVVSPSGSILCTAGRDDCVRVWSVNTASMLVEPLTHLEMVSDIAISRDETKVATSSDNVAYIWSLKEGTKVGIKSGERVSSIAFSPNSRLFVTGAGDGTARVWDVETGISIGQPLLHPEEEFNGRWEKPFVNANFSPDGKAIITKCRSDVRVWRFSLPVPVNRDRLSLFIEVHTGYSWDSSGKKRLFTPSEHTHKRNLLQELSKPGESRKSDDQTP